MSWLRRQDLEDREHNTLSRWAAFATDSGGRRAAEPQDPVRTDFQRDRDRIIHSAAFRRLQHKTQVLAAFEGDHFRTRMTHSLEVSQMARSASIALRLNPDLAEAVALAHDLGHPPFGHAGEEALHELMADHAGFRHNAQGLRIVDYLEDRHGDGFGLNLVRAVRCSLLKSTAPAGYPISDDLLPLEPPPLEARLVDLCDRIAYLCHDLDDGIRAGAFGIEDAQRLELWEMAASRARHQRPSGIISEMVALMMRDLVRTCAEEIDGATRERPTMRQSQEIAARTAKLQDFLRQHFYRADFVLERMAEGRGKIGEVFQRLLQSPDGLPDAVQQRIEADGIHRTVCDYVAGMTDRFLLKQR